MPKPQKVRRYKIFLTHPVFKLSFYLYIIYLFCLIFLWHCYFEDNGTSRSTDGSGGESTAILIDKALQHQDALNVNIKWFHFRQFYHCTLIILAMG